LFKLYFMDIKQQYTWKLLKTLQNMMCIHKFMIEKCRIYYLLKLRIYFLILLSSLITLNSFAQNSDYANLTSWDILPGVSNDVACSPNGDIFVVTDYNQTDQLGWSISKWNKTRHVFEDVRNPKIKPQLQFCSISVDVNNVIWATGIHGELCKWNGSDWDVQPGISATAVSCGKDGSIWVLGGFQFGGNASVFKLVRGTWQPIDGALGRRIAVAQNGVAWIANTNGEVYKYENSKWEKVGGPKVDGNDFFVLTLATGADGSVWAVEGGQTHSKIYKWQGGNNWEIHFHPYNDIDKIDISSNGHPIIINNGSYCYGQYNYSPIHHGVLMIKK